MLPTYPLATDAWDRLTSATRSAWARKSEVERRVILPGGGSVAVKSSDNPEGLRGAGYDGAILDELKDHGPKVWTESLRPTLADRQGWALMLGTPPRDLSHWSVELFHRAKDLAEWATWQAPSSSNPTLHASELEDARQALGGVVYAREFEAKFVAGAGGGMFKREAFRFYDPGELAGLPLSRFAVADLATSVKSWSDYTAAVHFGRAPDGRLFVLDAFRERVDGAALISTLAGLLARWGVGRLVLEAGGPLGAVNSMARAQGLPVFELAMGLRDKVSKATGLAGAVEAARVLFPRSAPWLEGALAELEAFPDPSSHDDVVDALALGVAAAPPFASSAPGPHGVVGSVVDSGRRDQRGQRARWLIGR